eukprot:GHVU01027543.1.p3 GENE.GHVU01027543.1~~GHVU01027543.1.p3  ORF type:complete len:125 (-),score=13.78 GHVU01027543.1:1787-2161(-)
MVEIFEPPQTLPRYKITNAFEGAGRNDTGKIEITPAMNHIFLEGLKQIGMGQRQMLHIVLRAPHEVEIWECPHFEEEVPPVLSVLLADADGMYAVSCQLKAHSAESPADTSNKNSNQTFRHSHQ